MNTLRLVSYVRKGQVEFGKNANELPLDTVVKINHRHINNSEKKTTLITNPFFFLLLLLHRRRRRL